MFLYPFCRHIDDLDLTEKIPLLANYARSTQTCNVMVINAQIALHKNSCKHPIIVNPIIPGPVILNTIFLDPIFLDPIILNPIFLDPIIF